MRLMAMLLLMERHRLGVRGKLASLTSFGDRVSQCLWIVLLDLHITEGSRAHGVLD